MTGSFRRAGSALAALLLVTTSACGGAAVTPGTSDSPGPPTQPASAAVSPSATASAPPTVAPSQPTPTPNQPRIGEITNVLFEQGFVNDATAVRGDPVVGGSSIRTSDSGALQFDVKNRIQSCTVTTSSEVRVQPSADVLVDFVAGSTTCNTVKSSEAVTLTALGAQIRTPDPVLVVTIEGDNVTIGVASGLAEIRNMRIGDDTPTYVGPKSVTVVPKEGPPGEPFRMDIGSYPEILGSAINRELAGIVQPPPGVPDPKGSAVLRRIAAGKAMAVGIDERLRGNRQLQTFIDLVIERQGQQWAIETKGVFLPADAVPAAFKEGSIELFVSADEIAGTPGPLPLVRDPGQDKAIVVSMPRDDVFLAAERAFLQDLVNRGDYRVSYLQSFDQEPDYSSLAGLFGLG